MLLAGTMDELSSNSHFQVIGTVFGAAFVAVPPGSTFIVETATILSSKRWRVDEGRQYAGKQHHDGALAAGFEACFTKSF